MTASTNAAAVLDFAAALRKAYNFGQTYWQQADSDSYSQQRKSNETADKFAQFVTDTVAALSQPAAAPQHSGCALCGASSVKSCNEIGCGFLESGNGEPAAVPVSGWISVDERLPEVGELVLVYVPAQRVDYPDDTRISFDCIDPNDDDHASWLRHNEHYEYFCCVAKPEGSTGPSERAPYTYWHALPADPGTEAAPVEQDAALTGVQFAAAQHLHTVQVQAEALAALRVERDLLSASLKQSDEVRDRLVKALREINRIDQHRQSSAGVIARDALRAAGEVL